MLDGAEDGMLNRMLYDIARDFPPHQIPDPEPCLGSLNRIVALPDHPTRQCEKCEGYSHGGVYPELIRDTPDRLSIRGVGIGMEEAHAENGLMTVRAAISTVGVALTDTKVAGRKASVTTAIVFIAALSLRATVLALMVASLFSCATRPKA